MLGAIMGDIVGSIYEGSPIKTPHFAPLLSPHGAFTDDGVLTVAVAAALLEQADYADKLREYYHYYPHAGYGGSFRHWAASGSRQPYQSWGNGSAMRVSPVGWAFDDLATVLHEAERSAAVTHNHPEGIKGAQATACAVFLARTGSSKPDIKAYVEATFGYDLSASLEQIRPTYTFDVSCQGSVPQAISAFLEATSYEDAVRLAVSLGGDSDTQACIAGSIAEAWYGAVPPVLAAQVWNDYLDERLRAVLRRFYAAYGRGTPPPE